MRRILILAAGVAALAGAGCGSSEPPRTPTACLAPASAYLAALRNAPEAVRLAGETPISDCLVADQQPGPLAQVGSAVIEAATVLNREARRRPAGPATVRLGYLVGAVQRAAAGTSGIHQDLTLRLDSSARYTSDGRPFGASFERAFGLGYAAGQEGG